MIQFSSVQFISVAQLCPTLCDPMNRSTPHLPVHHHLPEFTQTHVHRISDAIQPSHPLLSPSPPAPNPSQHHSLFNESTLCMRWSKYWSFSFSIIPSKEIPGLISFRMDCLDLLEVQGTLKRLLQHYSSKASIFQRSAFFTVQLSHPYMTPGKAYKKYLFYEWRKNKLISTKKCIFNVSKELTIHLYLCARNVYALKAQTILSILFTDTSLISRTMLGTQ